MYNAKKEKDSAWIAYIGQKPHWPTVGKNHTLSCNGTVYYIAEGPHEKEGPGDPRGRR